MFIRFNYNFLRLYLYIKPFLNWLLYSFIILLSNLILFGPVFLKEHKEYNILFYLHSIFATLNFLIYFILIVLISIFLLFKTNVLLQILETTSIFGIFISIFALLSGIAWGIFSWGNVVLFDSKVYLLVLILTVYLYIYYIFVKKQQISFFTTFLILVSLPFWKLISFWWTSYHQSFTISIIGASLPNNLWTYFFIFVYLFLFLYIYLLFLNLRTGLVEKIKKNV